VSCAGLAESLSAYADGELPPRERGAVEAHLGGCPACRGQLALLRRASTGLKRWFVRADESLPDVAVSRERLLATSLGASAALAARRRTRWRGLGAGALLALVAAAALAAFLWPPMARGACSTRPARAFSTAACRSSSPGRPWAPMASRAAR
jgi:anti-sigma factor RsiW